MANIALSLHSDEKKLNLKLFYKPHVEVKWNEKL